MKDDLEFLIEIRDKIKDGTERNDPTQIEYAQKMVDDWIDELISSTKVEILERPFGRTPTDFQSGANHAFTILAYRIEGKDGKDG